MQNTLGNNLFEFFIFNISVLLFSLRKFVNAPGLLVNFTSRFFKLSYFRNYILPDKEYSTKRRAQNTDQEGTDEKKKGKSRRKPAYTGGLVLEPKKG